MDCKEQPDPALGKDSPQKRQEPRPGQPEAAVLHIDSRGEPCLPTSEALRVLLYPQEVPENGEAQQMLSRQIRYLFPSGPLAEETAPVGEFISGRRRYTYRICRLRTAPHDGSGLVAVMVIERQGHRLVPAAESLAPFHLTVREEQVLRGVLQGYSNKRIAEGMGISENTVKAFVRHILTKLGVSNRFGILTRFMGRTEPRYRPGPPRRARMPAPRLPGTRLL